MYRRTTIGIFSVFFKKQFYIAFINIFRFFYSPFGIFLEYIFRLGSYPKEIFIRTPIGKQNVTLYCSDDMITVVECFGKLDYPAKKDISCVVDFGSNIGISALYFLTRNAQLKVYLFEPLSQNIERLKRNLNGFENRYKLDPVAVGLKNGTNSFGCEPTGRYGGLNKKEMRNWLDEMNLSHPFVIAGPCSAETEDQVMKIANQLKDTDVTAYRAGIWKPRTRPGMFEGVGAIGLNWLGRVKKETGLLTTTEVANSVHVDLALKHDIDILWIGARSTVSPFIVQEIANALKGTDKIILIKNPVNPDLSLWLGGIERIYTSDIKKVGVIHRGFSTKTCLLLFNALIICS